MITSTLVVAATLSLLGLTLAEEYVPMHKRFTYRRDMNDFNYLGMLAKRDSCSDAFGSSAHNSICAPDFTLCCRCLAKSRTEYKQ